MRIARLILAKICCPPVIILTALLILSACNTPENQLAEREARIRTKESELVTLFAELIEQRKSLEQHQSDKLVDTQQHQENPATDTGRTNPCEPSPAENSKQLVTKIEKRTILGGLENVFLDPPGMEFSARIDTGAQTSSLHALDIVEFERDGKPFVKFSMIHPKTKEKIELTRRLRRYVRVKELGNRESQRRPVVRMRVVLADIDERINFTLENRSRFKHQVLIGRNLLQDLAIVDVSKKYTAVKTDRPGTSGVK